MGWSVNTYASYKMPNILPDSDEYQIIQETSLLPPEHVEPASYKSAGDKELDRPSTIDDICDFVVEYINSDVLVSSRAVILLAQRVLIWSSGFAVRYPFDHCRPVQGKPTHLIVKSDRIRQPFHKCLSPAYSHWSCSQPRLWPCQQHAIHHRSLFHHQKIRGIQVPMDMSLHHQAQYFVCGLLPEI